MQAFINPYLFMLARPPHQVVWDYLHHTQFELDLPHCQRLALLIANPALFDKAHSIDKAFLEANLFTGTPIASIEWKWDELSKYSISAPKTYRKIIFRNRSKSGQSTTLLIAMKCSRLLLPSTPVLSAPRRY